MSFRLSLSAGLLTRFQRGGAHPLWLRRCDCIPGGFVGLVAATYRGTYAA